MSKTIQYPPKLDEGVRRAGFSMRTRVRSDGRITYEVVDNLTGKVKARSRNFQKVNSHMKAQLAR